MLQYVLELDCTDFRFNLTLVGGTLPLLKRPTYFNRFWPDGKKLGYLLWRSLGV